MRNSSKLVTDVEKIEMDLLEKRCENVEGTKVIYVYENGDPIHPFEGGMRRPARLKVAGCDPYIGITITDVDDRTHNEGCLNGPSSSNGVTNCMTQDQYMEVFMSVLEDLEEGIHVYDKADRVMAKARGMAYCRGGGMGKCAFSA